MTSQETRGSLALSQIRKENTEQWTWKEEWQPDYKHTWKTHKQKQLIERHQNNNKSRKKNIKNTWEQEEEKMEKKNNKKQDEQE